MSVSADRVLSTRKFLGLWLGNGADGKTPTLSLGLIPPVQPAETRLVGIRPQDAALLAEQLDAAAEALSDHLGNGHAPQGGRA